VGYGIGRGAEEPRKTVRVGDRHYRECKRGEVVRMIFKFLYRGRIDALMLVWSLENDEEDKIEMHESLSGTPSEQQSEMNLEVAGLVPEYATPGRYDLETLRVYYADRRHAPREFEPPKVGLLVVEEKVEMPQLRGFGFE
jgi:hypothetical protein